jgi:hypothetical protein
MIILDIVAQDTLIFKKKRNVKNGNVALLILYYCEYKFHGGSNRSSVIMKPWINWVSLSWLQEDTIT